MLVSLPNALGDREEVELNLAAGDIIIISPSAIAAFRHWPDMMRELEEDQHDSQVYYYKHTGELILGPTTFGFDKDTGIKDCPTVAPHQVRKKFYRMLLRQVARLGLEVEYGQRVERYFEDEAAGVGGVATGKGMIRVADVVVAADANKSCSDVLIFGEPTPTHSSGMSVFRTALPTECAMRGEEFRKRWGDAIAQGQISHEFWAGPGMHLGLMVSRDFTAFGLTPRDSNVISNGVKPVESWDPDIDPEAVIEVLRRLPGWHPAIEEIVSNTPKGSIIQWPLLWRNLRRHWTSRGGRVVQVGEAAHSSIPSSASGGTLAMEDAVTLASCLQLACLGGGSDGAPMGTRVYNLLRYERVSCSQKLAFVNAEVLSGADMGDVTNDPDKIRIRLPKWLFQHEPEAYAYEKYGQAFAHLICGAPYQNTNTPPGHVVRPWTIEEIHKDARKGKKLAEFLDGDWS
jgi:2-polyprenyl-6-methoxyphenol hydroxylase-like FAD-dependent oxidoreductase